MIVSCIKINVNLIFSTSKLYTILGVGAILYLNSYKYIFLLPYLKALLTGRDDIKCDDLL